MVGMAQLASAPDCGSGGRGFKSLYPPFFYIMRNLDLTECKLISWAIAKR